MGKVDLLAGKTYRLSGCPTGGNTSYRLDVRHLETSTYGGSVLNDAMDFGDGVEFTCTENETVNVCIRIAEETTVNNLIFKPMLYLAEIEDATFEKYTKQTLTSLTPNGLPGIKVTDASLATYTDADGQMWCADEKDYERGVYVQRVLVETVDLKLTGTKTKTKIYVGHMSATMRGGSTGGLCSISKTYGFHENDTEHFYIGRTVGQVFVYVPIDMETEPTTATVAGVLATPIETPLSAEEIAAYKALHTNKPTTTVMNSENVHMKVDYVADTKNHITQNYVPLSEYTALEERVAAIEELVIS